MRRRPPFPASRVPAVAFLAAALAFSGSVARAQTAGEAAPATDPVQAAKEAARKSKLTTDESEANADKRDLLMTVGQNKTVDLDFEANVTANGITVGNPGLVTTTLAKIGDKRQIVFTPLKAGDTTVTVRDPEGNIKLIFNTLVTETDLDRKSVEIKDLLKDIEGLQIRVMGEKIVLDGELLVPADYARLLSVITDGYYKDAVLNLTVLSPIAMRILSDRIQQDISAFSPNVKTRVVNGMIFLEGTTDNLDQARRAQEIANLYLPEVKPGDPLQSKDPNAKAIVGRRLVQNFIVVNPPPPKKQEKLVRITVHFVELAKSYSKSFGFKWQPGFTSDPQIQIGPSASGATQSGGISFSATLSSLFPKLASAKEAGYARVLRTATVIVRSGQEGKLEEITEFPYTVLGANGQSGTERAPIGLVISVNPQIVGQSEDIAMGVNLQQSALQATTSGGQPITSKHTMTTSLYIKSSESAAIGGIMSNDIGTDFNKSDPNKGTFDGNTGPLFSLLRSKAYRKKKSQFVVFLTPEIVENASEGTEDLKKNFRVKVK